MMTLTRNNFPIFIILLICAATLGSCDESETVIPKGRPITFTTEDNRGDEPTQSRTIRTTSGNGDIIVDVTVEDDECSATRLTEDSEGDVSFAEGDAFGVFAYYMKDGSETLLMDNVKVTKKGNVWECSETVYWPLNSPGTEITFYAYYPYNEGLEINDGNITLAAGAEPIMWATETYPSDKNKYGSTVNLTFEQKMARVSFEVINLKGNEVTVDNVTLTGIGTSETLNVKDGELVSAGEGEKLTIEVKNEGTKEGVLTSGYKGNLKGKESGVTEFYVNPNTSSSITITFGEDTKTLDIEAGKKYHYRIIFADLANDDDKNDDETLLIHNEDVLKEILTGDYVSLFCSYRLVNDMNFSEETLTPSTLFARGYCVMFNGAEHSISNFKIDIDGAGTGDEYAGLFSEAAGYGGFELNGDKGVYEYGVDDKYVLDDYVNNGHVIKDLTISNFSVSVNESTGDAIYAGGLIGYATGTTIENCWIDCGEVSAGGESDINVGGVVGRLYNSNIVGCIATRSGMVADGESVWCGGLVGEAFDSAIYICGVTNVKMSATGDSYVYCGGCVGKYNSSAYGFCWCNYCKEISFVEMQNDRENGPWVGGFVGKIDGNDLGAHDVDQIFKCNFWINSEEEGSVGAVGNEGKFKYETDKDNKDDEDDDTTDGALLEEVITKDKIEGNVEFYINKEAEGSELPEVSFPRYTNVMEALNGAIGFIEINNYGYVKKFPWEWKSNEDGYSTVPLVPTEKSGTE